MNEQEELVNRIKANPNFKLEDIESCGKPVLLELVKQHLPEEVLGEFKHEPVEGTSA